MIVFDLETTEIPKEGISKIKGIHCIAAKCIETGELYFADRKTGYDSILKTLSNASGISGHNIIGFDIPVLQHFFPDFKPQGEVFDTLVMARALWNDVIIKDFGRVKAGRLPARLKGRHSLEAYGYRLGCLKGEYGRITEDAWDKYTPEMAEYCKQDVEVTAELYLREMKACPSEKMWKIENKFASAIHIQEDTGVMFDFDKALDLTATLRTLKTGYFDQLVSEFGPVMEPVANGKTFISTRKNVKMKILTAGVEYCKIKMVEFNPGSRLQIAERLIKKYGWKPVDFSPKGGVTINEKILASLDYPEAKLLTEYLTVGKRLSQMADGNQAWMKKITMEGRIHGRVNTGGAISGRCTHSTPNLAQVPASGAPFGSECRSLFTVRKGYKLIGCDASGLELRCLAHYLHAFDGGVYGNTILNGDIHVTNQQAAGLKTRNLAKKFIYMWLYGAGAAALSAELACSKEEASKTAQKFIKKSPAIKKLKELVAEKVKTNGYLKGLDGRRLRTRSDHSALNLLLQSAGALVMKQWLVLVMEQIELHWLDAKPVLNIHDEAQFEVREDHAQGVADICEAMMPKAGEYFNFKIPIEGEAKIGNNWSETH